jgi:predicted transcriptional regulator of viral defense system
MRWERILELLRGEVVFRSPILLAAGEDPAIIRRQLLRWVRAGRLDQLRRGVYAVAAPYRTRVPHPFVVAGLLRPASYVSLQSALAHHGLIPEHVPTVTSVTTGRPETLDTSLGRFVFRHVSKRLFRGYDLVRFGGAETAFVASAEKAVLDTVHLSKAGDSEAFLRELRLQNAEVLELERLKALAEQSGSPKLRRAAALLAQLVLEARS